MALTLIQSMKFGTRATEARAQETDLQVHNPTHAIASVDTGLP